MLLTGKEIEVNMDYDLWYVLCQCLSRYQQKLSWQECSELGDIRNWVHHFMYGIPWIQIVSCKNTCVFYFCRLFPFGLGARVCVGDDFAKTRLFVFLTALVQHFDILPPSEKELLSCDPRLYHSGAVLQMDRFSCILSPVEWKLDPKEPLRQTTKFTSAKFLTDISPSYILFRNQRIEDKQGRSGHLNRRCLQI